MSGHRDKATSVGQRGGDWLVVGEGSLSGNGQNTVWRGNKVNWSKLQFFKKLNQCGFCLKKSSSKFNLGKSIAKHNQLCFLICVYGLNKDASRQSGDYFEIWKTLWPGASRKWSTTSLDPAIKPGVQLWPAAIWHSPRVVRSGGWSDLNFVIDMEV